MERPTKERVKGLCKLNLPPIAERVPALICAHYRLRVQRDGALDERTWHLGVTEGV